MMPPVRARRSKELLFVCTGTSCHQNGSAEVLPCLRQSIRAHGLEADVELVGAFCLESCEQGPAMKHRDRLFRHLKPGNFASRFESEILPSLRNALGPDAAIGRGGTDEDPARSNAMTEDDDSG